MFFKDNSTRTYVFAQIFSKHFEALSFRLWPPRMASFERKEGKTSKAHSSGTGQKLPLKRFEPAIYRFTKIAIPMDMERLDRHKYNLQKYVKWKNWSKFDVEKNNAERTIKQLKTNIHDMNAIRIQVEEKDLSAFDDKVKHLADKALAEIQILREIIDSCEETRNEGSDESGTGSVSPQSSDTDIAPLSPSQANMFSSVELRNKSTRPASSQEQQPLARFEVTLRTFTKITIPTAMERLHMHCQNMEKFYEANLWDRLNSEQVNAAITVKHLKSNIQDIETTRRQVPINELVLFDKRVGPSYQQALEAIDSFMKFQQKYRSLNHSNQSTGLQDCGSDNVVLADQQIEGEQMTCDDTLYSWDELESSLVELNQLIHDFSHLVHEQQSSVDTITANIEHAQANIHEGTQELGKAAKLQGLLLPTLGAVVGGVVGGPIGMLAGFKAVALLTAVGGGVVGYGATSYIKQKREHAVDTELEKLTRDSSENDHT